MSDITPLRFEPIYKQYIWGGRRLETELGRSLPDEGVFAESWEISDHGEEQSVVETGPLAGKTLHELVTRRGEELLGRHYPQTRFPLLVKYLDAQKPLSVQVHPDDALARQMGLADLGKTEAWCILRSEPGSVIWAGFRGPVDRDVLRQAIEEGKLEDHLHRFEPQPGECVFLPAGTVHALGAGILVAEIQQTSDNTFRLYDWNRVGADGKPRELHVDRGLEAIDYAQGEVAPRPPQETARPHVERLVDCEKFLLDRCRIASPQKLGDGQRCHVVTVLEGAVNVAGDPTGEPLPMGRTVLLPAAAGEVQLSPAGGQEAVVLDAYVA